MESLAGTYVINMRYPLGSYVYFPKEQLEIVKVDDRNYRVFYNNQERSLISELALQTAIKIGFLSLK